MPAVDTRSVILERDGGLQLALRRARLRVEEGPDAGREVALGDRPLILGRGADADMRLSDSTVSRRHAVIRAEGEAWKLVDLDSKSGVLVDGAKVREATLGNGSRIRLGVTELSVLLEDAEVSTAEVELERAGALGGLVAESEAMSRVLSLLERVAGLDLTVLLHGESGTGKEALARAIHEASPWKDGPYEVVDCTLLSGDHLRSELFGHVKGAFTGADRERAGAFARADGGTLFLDEIGDLPLALQAPLLRVLEEGEVRPLGSDRTLSVRTRVVGASHRDLLEAVRDGTFRQDLYYRLSGAVVEIPPLRDRGGDVLLLARHFLASGLELSSEAEDALVTHPWPGNVRELRHCMRRASALARKGVVRPGDLGLRKGPGPQDAAPVVGPGPAAPGGAPQTLEDQEAEAIRAALERFNGNRKLVAEALGIGRTTLWRKLKKLGLD